MTTVPRMIVTTHQHSIYILSSILIGLRDISGTKLVYNLNPSMNPGGAQIKLKGGEWAVTYCVTIGRYPASPITFIPALVPPDLINSD